MAIYVGTPESPMVNKEVERGSVLHEVETQSHTGRQL